MLRIEFCEVSEEYVVKGNTPEKNKLKRRLTSRCKRKIWGSSVCRLEEGGLCSCMTFEEYMPFDKRDKLIIEQNRSRRQTIQEEIDKLNAGVK